MAELADFSTEDVCDLIGGLLDSGRARVAEGGEAVERVMMGMWAPIFQRNPAGYDTPWGRGMLTVEGMDLLYRRGIERRHFAGRQPPPARTPRAI